MKQDDHMITKLQRLKPQMGGCKWPSWPEYDHISPHPDSLL